MFVWSSVYICVKVYSGRFTNLHAFHMVNTRSNNTKAKEDKMTTATDELKCYFEKLIEPLVTNNSLEELFNKLKDEIMKKFDEKISEQIPKLKNLNQL